MVRSRGDSTPQQSTVKPSKAVMICLSGTLDWMFFYLLPAVPYIFLYKLVHPYIPHMILHASASHLNHGHRSVLRREGLV